MFNHILCEIPDLVKVTGEGVVRSLVGKQYLVKKESRDL